MSENEITGQIIASAVKAHKTLGPGLLESAYEACLYYELVNNGLSVERQKAIPLVYEEVKFGLWLSSGLIGREKGHC